jgi:hypothetical protein
MYKFKLRSLRPAHLKNTLYSCSLSNLYEKFVGKLPALNGFQRLSCPNVALQRALNKQLLNQRLVYPSPLVLRQGPTLFLLNSR